MKKTALTVFGVVFCLFLTACGGGEDEARPFEAADVDAILASGSFSEELEMVEADLVCALYGLEEGAVTSCTAYLSTGATSEEVVLFTVADESGVEAVKAACEGRVAEQILGYEDYKPGEVPKLEEAIIEVRGTTVLLVVANDAEGAAAAVDALK